MEGASRNGHMLVMKLSWPARVLFHNHRLLMAEAELDIQRLSVPELLATAAGMASAGE
jgi:hypothetical protein